MQWKTVEKSLLKKKLHFNKLTREEKNEELKAFFNFFFFSLNWVIKYGNQSRKTIQN